MEERVKELEVRIAQLDFQTAQLEAEKSALTRALADYQGTCDTLHKQLAQVSQERDYWEQKAAETPRDNTKDVTCHD